MMPLNSEFDQFFDTLPIFCDLTSSQVETARSVLHCMSVPAGHTLITQAQPGEKVYIVATGSVAVHAHNGVEDALIGLRGPGEVVGEMSVLDGMSRSATVITQEKSLIFWLSHADFWDVLWEMPPISYNFVRLLSQRLRVLTLQMQALSTLDVQGRLARQLVILAEEYGQPYPTQGPDAVLIPFQLKQAELASMIGSTREQVNGLLSSWRRRGFISRDSVRKSHIVVCRFDALLKIYQPISS